MNYVIFCLLFKHKSYDEDGWAALLSESRYMVETGIRTTRKLIPSEPGPERCAYPKTGTLPVDASRMAALKLWANIAHKEVPELCFWSNLSGTADYSVSKIEYL